MWVPAQSCSRICLQPSRRILWLPVNNNSNYLWGVCDWPGTGPRAYFMLAFTQSWHNQSLGYVICPGLNMSLGQRANAKSGALSLGHSWSSQCPAPKVSSLATGL